MARMPSKRWVEMVENFGEKERYCLGSDILYREDVAKLLSRQHAKFVRRVKQLDPLHLGDREYINRDDLLAALQQGGKK